MRHIITYDAGLTQVPLHARIQLGAFFVRTLPQTQCNSWISRPFLLATIEQPRHRSSSFFASPAESMLGDCILFNKIRPQMFATAALCYCLKQNLQKFVPCGSVALQVSSRHANVFLEGGVGVLILQKSWNNALFLVDLVDLVEANNMSSINMLSTLR